LGIDPTPTTVDPCRRRYIPWTAVKTVDWPSYHDTTRDTPYGVPGLGSTQVRSTRVGSTQVRSTGVWSAG